MSNTADNVPTILVVDDDEDIRIPLTHLLRREGYRVFAAANAIEAARMALENIPNVILMDIGMPKIDGLTALWKMREDPELAEVPVVIVSAYDSFDLRAESASLGCKGYLAKPIDFEELNSLIASLAEPASKQSASPS